MSRVRPAAGSARGLLALLALVAALSLLAGCGGDDEADSGDSGTRSTDSGDTRSGIESTEASPSTDGDADPAKAEYEKGVREALVAVTQTKTTLDEITDAKTADDLAAGVAQLKTTYESVAEDLKALTPPEEVADLHTRLVEANVGIARAASDAEESIRGGDSDAGGTLFKKAGAKYGTTLTKLGEEFSARGYEFR